MTINSLQPAQLRTTVVQASARRQYAVARALYRAGMLDRLVLDMAPDSSLLLLRGGRPEAVGLPEPLIRSLPVAGPMYRGFMRAVRPATAWPQAWIGKRLARVVAGELRKSHPPDQIYGYDINSLESFLAARQQFGGIVLILEQCIAPRSAQLTALEKLSDVMPRNSVVHRRRNLIKLLEREEAEWDLANIVIAPSSFVADELIRAGCNPSKILVVSYGHSSSFRPAIRVPRVPLRGIFVGTIDYRKGFHDLNRIAKIFRGAVHFRAVGRSAVDDGTLASQFGNIEHVGPLTFAETQREYYKADFLILPSYIEGSAMVVYEAMSTGLPCVVTRQTGSPITNGVDGRIFEAGDIEGVSRIIQEFISRPSLISELSFKAAEASLSTLSSASYERRLLSAIAGAGHFR